MRTLKQEGRVAPMRRLSPARRSLIFGVFLAIARMSWAAVNVSAADNTFERTLTVSGPVRVELSNGSGNVEIKGSVDGKVHIFGKVTGGWSLFGSSDKNTQEVMANPPIEQRDAVIRIGKNVSWSKDVSIDYNVEVPHDTEIDAGVASGGITVDNVKGPVKASSASGYVHVYRVDRDATTNAASGSIEVVEASNDVKVHAISGSIQVSGNPSASRLWELKTVSGSVELRVPKSASFLLSAESTSGDIRTSIPVILEEQSKHSLRAHIGDSSGRVEVHTVSGSVSVGNGS